MKTQFILTPFILDRFSPDLENLADTGWILNKPPLPKGDVQTRMSAIHKEIASHVAETRNAGMIPVSIAGDCCPTIGVTAGLQRAGVNPLLIWFDAHGDFNTWDTTPSGFLGGMPLAMTVGLGEQKMPQAVGLRSLPQENIILTDARDLDPGEKALVRGSKIRHLRDPKELVEIPLAGHEIYVHFDTDVINPLDAPAMSYLAKGGPRASELEEIFRYLAQTGQIAAVSMATWNPDSDKDRRSRDTSLTLLSILLGK